MLAEEIFLFCFIDSLFYLEKGNFFIGVYEK
jgi:hypothetical protein